VIALAVALLEFLEDRSGISGDTRSAYDWCASGASEYTRRVTASSLSVSLVFSLCRVGNTDLLALALARSLARLRARARARAPACSRKNSRKVHDWWYEYFGDLTSCENGSDVPERKESASACTRAHIAHKRESERTSERAREKERKRERERVSE